MSLSLARAWAKTKPIGNSFWVAIDQGRSCRALRAARAPLSYPWEAYLCRSGLFLVGGLWVDSLCVEL